LVPKAACDPKTVLKACQECTLEKIDQEAKESRNINLMWLLEQFLELASVFKEASRNFNVYLSRE
jgi:hypothetical protein